MVLPHHFYPINSTTPSPLLLHHRRHLNPRGPCSKPSNHTCNYYLHIWVVVKPILIQCIINAHTRLATTGITQRHASQFQTSPPPPFLPIWLVPPSPSPPAPSRQFVVSSACLVALEVSCYGQAASPSVKHTPQWNFIHP